MIRMRLCLLALLLAACTNSAPNSHGGPPLPQPTGPPITYAAIGASETVGVGATDPTHDAWPQVFFRTALPQSTVFYNFGIPGANVDTALSDELPDALSVQPTLVTVWLNVNDLVAGESAAVYEGRLDQLVHALRRGGAARVLVANTPYLDHLPAYIECRGGTAPPGVTCPSPTMPGSDVLNADVAAYNESIARVVQSQGAILVDLHSQGEVPDVHPDWVSSDGFHPSSSGYAAIAAEFASALKGA